jgi:hypothetical protein
MYPDKPKNQAGEVKPQQIWRIIWLFVGAMVIFMVLMMQTNNSRYAPPRISLNELAWFAESDQVERVAETDGKLAIILSDGSQYETYKSPDESLVSLLGYKNAAEFPFSYVVVEPMNFTPVFFLMLLVTAILSYFAGRYVEAKRQIQRQQLLNNEMANPLSPATPS